MDDLGGGGELDAEVDAARARLHSAAHGSALEANLVSALADLLADRYQQRISGGDLAGAHSDLAESVRWLDEAVARAGGTSARSAELAWRAGFAHDERWGLLSDAADRDAAIRFLTDLIALTVAPVPLLPAIHSVLARAYASRSAEPPAGGPEAADLDAAISHARDGLAVLWPQAAGDVPVPAGPAEDGPDLGPELSLILGLSLADRFAAAQARLGPGATNGVSAARADRDESITVLTAVLGKIPADDDPLRLAVADALGQARYDRYSDTWPAAPRPDPADLDAAIELLLIAVAGEADPQAMEHLVLALADRLDLRPDAADRDRLIIWGERLLDSGQYSGPAAGFIHELLSSALADRAEACPQGCRADLSAAITHRAAVLAVAPPGDPDRTAALAWLAHAYWLRLDGDASRHDEVDAMTSYAEQAWTLLPVGDEDRAQIGLYLAVGVHERLLRPDVPFDVAAASRAIDVLTDIAPQFAYDQTLQLITAITLGHFLVARGQATGSAADLAAAQPWLLQGAAGLPAGDPGWADLTQTLAVGMCVLASLGMAADHLDQAIGLLSAAAERADPDRDRAAMTRGSLGLLLVQRAAFTGGQADLDQGISHLTASFDLAAPSHAYRVAVAVNLSGALLARFFERGDAQDVDAARHYLDIAGELTGSVGDAVRSLMADADVIVAGNRGLLGVIEAMLGDPSGLDRAVPQLRAAYAMLPPGHPYRDRIRGDIGMALALRAMQHGNRAEDLRAAASELRAAVAALAANHLMRPAGLLRAGGALAAAAATAGDAPLLREAISYLSAAMRELDPRFGGRFRFVALLGSMAEARHRITGDPADLDAAIAWLEEARHALAARPSHPQYADVLSRLARAYRTRGDAAAAVEAGFAALRGRSRDALLQSGTARSIGYARITASEAAEVAGWCLDDQEPTAAVEALELGRGLILHAATSVAELPELLAAAGRHDLAREWRDAVASRQETPWDAGLPGAGYLPGLLAGTIELRVPDDLRGRVLAALAGSVAGERLLTPPPPAEIAAALALTGADAVVYLLGPAGRNPGRAVLVSAASLPANGAGTAAPDAARPQEIPLPRLRGDAVQKYAAACTALLVRPSHGSAGGQDRVTARQPGVAGWRQALDDLCKWAGPAVMQPVLARIRPAQDGHPPRLVLIAAGRLSLVPWHAARSGSHYVLRDAVISYAASGRQLVEAARRPPLPLADDPVILGDPTRTLPAAAAEAEAIHDRCYPGGRYLGYARPDWGGRVDGPGTPREVLRQLPAADHQGASMLHLGCHGLVVGSAPGRSHLLLAGGQELRVDAILRQASGRPPHAPGGLVSLAACTSDLAAADYDEALTPATAFLAAGAATVVGARWQIPDGATSLFMFMFHYLMTAGGHPPRDALRLAQLWMLDPHRAAPAEMPPELAEHASRPELADVVAWGGLVHQGR